MKKQLINYTCKLPLVGIAGPAGSGKNTVADIISSQFDVVQYAFAQPLKQMLQQGLGLNRHDTDGYRKEKVDARYGKSPREMLQTLGTEWGRNMVHPDIWVIATNEYCQALHNENRVLSIVLTDVRFENEADWVRQNGGVIIHVQRLDASPVAAHASENGIKRLDADFTIHNDGDLEHLRGVTLNVARLISEQKTADFLHAS